MVDVPAVTPSTEPVVEPTDTFALLLVQIPAPSASERPMIRPMQTLPGPDIAGGAGLIVTVVVAVDVKPLPSVIVKV